MAPKAVEQQLLHRMMIGIGRRFEAWGVGLPHTRPGSKVLQVTGRLLRSMRTSAVLAAVRVPARYLRVAAAAVMSTTGKVGFNFAWTGGSSNPVHSALTPHGVDLDMQ